MFRQNQSRKVQHGTDADAGAQIRRAGCQITQLIGEGETQLLLKCAIRVIYGHPSLFELQTGEQGLHAEVVLLVDHDAEAFAAVQHQTTAGALGGVLAADQVRSTRICLSKVESPWTPKRSLSCP